MMIVDDSYIIVGSANINERSMSGTRDTEMAVRVIQEDAFHFYIWHIFHFSHIFFSLWSHLFTGLCFQVGCWQPQFSSYNPYGEVARRFSIISLWICPKCLILVDIVLWLSVLNCKVHMFRMGLWAEHLKTWEEAFRFPGTLECTQVTTWLLLSTS